MDPTALRLLISALSLQINVQDTRHLLRYSEFEDFITTTQSYLHSCDLISTAIHSDFTSSIQCLLCKSNYCKVVLSCHHQFCKSCLSAYTETVSHNFEIPFSSLAHSLACPECTAPISETDTTEIFKDFWPKPASSINRKAYDRPRRCIECNIMRSPNKFYYTCNHVCVFCGFKNLAETKACTLCNCNSIASVVKTVGNGVICQGCETKKMLTEDFVIEICKEHLHCYECLKIAWKDMKCKVCNEWLDVSTQGILRKHIFSECSGCKNMVEKKFIVRKECCRNIVCVHCQKVFSNTNCKTCGRQLGPLVSAKLKNLYGP